MPQIDPFASVSQSGGITGVCHHARLCVFVLLLYYKKEGQWLPGCRLDIPLKLSDRQGMVAQGTELGVPLCVVGPASPSLRGSTVFVWGERGTKQLHRNF